MSVQARKRKSVSRKSVDERRQQLASLRERLAEFEAQLEPGELAYILAKWQGYSRRNAISIAMHRQDATEVAGYREWQARGRQVRKGEVGIAILAPMPGWNPNKGEGEPVCGEPGEGDGKLRFRLARVFDVAQTDPIDADGTER